MVSCSKELLEKETEMSVKITVTWVPFRRQFDDWSKPVASMEFEMLELAKELYTDEELCEYIYAATNNYSGHIFAAMEKVGLPKERSHTALSVGDIIGIDNIFYLVDDFGFKKMMEVRA